MKRKVLDIWAIEKNPDELNYALEQIKSDVTIFENVICEFKIGAHLLRNRQFDKIIYSEESDVIILLMRGGPANIEQAEKYLNEHKIDYNKIVFTEEKTKYNDDGSKEFWFARQPDVLEDALNNSLQKDIKECEYDATLEASLTFKYNSRNNKKYQLLKIPFKGLLELDDKFILITNSKYNKNINYTTILNMLDKKGFKTGLTGLSEFI